MSGADAPIEAGADVWHPGRQDLDSPPYRGIIDVLEQTVPYIRARRTWRCQHHHRTREAAIACATRMMRARQ